MSTQDVISDLEPKSWDEIYDSPSLVDEDGHVNVGGFERGYTRIGDCFRTYDGTVYVSVEEGWVAFGAVSAALSELLNSKSEP